MKIRIYPNSEQKQLLLQAFGCARFVYNYCLGVKKEMWEFDKMNVGSSDLNTRIAEMKKEEEYKWLGDAYAQTLQQAVLNLDKAYKSFFRRNKKKSKQKGFPKFKRKFGKQSIGFPQGVKVVDRKIHVPKIGWINAVTDNRLNEGVIKTVTISKDKCNNYYAAFCMEIDKEFPLKSLIDEQTTVGIDFGLKDFAVFSDVRRILRQDHSKGDTKRIRHQQRNLARKKKGSRNFGKNKLRIARLYQRIVNRREDFLHKFTYKLTHENQVRTIAIEDLNIQGMMQFNSGIARSFAEQGIGRCIELLRYKCEWYGVNLLQVDRFYPSSQICSVCGYQNKSLMLDDREWTCPVCLTKHDRDLNGAINIKQQSLKQIGRGTPELMSVEKVNVDDRKPLILKKMKRLPK
ncbi:MAG: RNA-guided endonuclease InsQ/TnpB family protein, partial [Vulcanimicrobiaceae bacterium]